MMIRGFRSWPSMTSDRGRRTGLGNYDTIEEESDESISKARASRSADVSANLSALR